MGAFILFPFKMWFSWLFFFWYIFFKGNFIFQGCVRIKKKSEETKEHAKVLIFHINIKFYSRSEKVFCEDIVLRVLFVLFLTATSKITTNILFHANSTTSHC